MSAVLYNLTLVIYEFRLTFALLKLADLNNTTYNVRDYQAFEIYLSSGMFFPLPSVFEAQLIFVSIYTDFVLLILL